MHNNNNNNNNEPINEQTKAIISQLRAFLEDSITKCNNRAKNEVHSFAAKKDDKFIEKSYHNKIRCSNLIAVNHMIDDAISRHTTSKNMHPMRKYHISPRRKQIKKILNTINNNIEKEMIFFAKNKDKNDNTKMFYSQSFKNFEETRRNIEEIVNDLTLEK